MLLAASLPPAASLPATAAVLDGGEPVRLLAASLPATVAVPLPSASLPGTVAVSDGGSLGSLPLPATDGGSLGSLGQAGMGGRVSPQMRFVSGWSVYPHAINPARVAVMSCWFLIK